MSDAAKPAVPTVPATPTLAMIATLGLVSALCGLIIVGAYQGSLEAVKDNRRIAMQRAIEKVLPGAARTISWHAMADGSVVPAAPGADAPAGALTFHAAYDPAGALMGIAAEGVAKGYADTVRVLFGWSSHCQCVVGLGVVSMRETPGIGDKILTDAEFLANFKALDVQLDADLKGLANEVKAVKHGSKTQPWQVDAISGATITSRAVARAINDAAGALLPRLVPNLAKIEKGP
jgi:electron transport complex protein RnfG